MAFCTFSCLRLSCTVPLIWSNELIKICSKFFIIRWFFVYTFVFRLFLFHFSYVSDTWHRNRKRDPAAMAVGAHELSGQFSSCSSDLGNATGNDRIIKCLTLNHPLPSNCTDLKWFQLTEWTSHLDLVFIGCTWSVDKDKYCMNETKKGNKLK